MDFRHCRRVEKDKIGQLLRAAMAAPSAMNQQPWEFYVVTAEDTLQKLSECSPYAGMLKEAPLGIVVCCQKGCRLPNYAQIDCSAAVENLLLEADSLGLGAVWLGIYYGLLIFCCQNVAINIHDHLYSYIIHDFRI